MSANVEEDGDMQTTSPGMTRMQYGGGRGDDAREVGLGMIFRYGMEASTIVQDKIVVATRSRDGEAAIWWRAVAEAVEQATQPPQRDVIVSRG
jgi:hypothetical protein